MTLTGTGFSLPSSSTSSLPSYTPMQTTASLSASANGTATPHRSPHSLSAAATALARSSISYRGITTTPVLTASASASASASAPSSSSSVQWPSATRADAPSGASATSIMHGHTLSFQHSGSASGPLRSAGNNVVVGTASGGSAAAQDDVGVSNHRPMLNRTMSSAATSRGPAMPTSPSPFGACAARECHLSSSRNVYLHHTKSQLSAIRCFNLMA